MCASTYTRVVHLFSANLDGSSIRSLSTLPEDTGATSPNFSEVMQFLTLSPNDFYIVRNIRNAVGFDVINRRTLVESVVSNCLLAASGVLILVF